ncbi:helix-turn-helix domain-containing protein [Rhodococcus sp. NPDC055112]
MTAGIESPWMTVREVAEYARRSTDSVYTALQVGELAGHQTKAPKGKWSIHREAIDRWLAGERPAASRTKRLRSA